MCPWRQIFPSRPPSVARGIFNFGQSETKPPTFFGESFDVQQSTKRELRTVGTQLEVHSIDWCSEYWNWGSIGPSLRASFPAVLSFVRIARGFISPILVPASKMSYLESSVRAA
ncbi:unnamed protein product [Cyberlindnera jadinii]|uniref:Uncharacterized protein n=1 Tax=Cyberlindnera jadinii (strain ATCC 18201 / CBS 1600 / BCRC 20928 / JCM 3617 / NBRC 0987 / NRRL Y-1542) TaxID=983966 RepID=A0A0H5C9E6_CYBJN|nr:unnamed protein product [Cyberlindnera jadinii]